MKSFPEWRDTPIILGESDPEGCAACSARTNPQNGYRNGALYAAYTAEALNATYSLAAREQVHLAGSVSWSFEFEDQPYFEGFRELATNGLDKPVLNAFRMFGLLGSERVKVSSTGAIPTDKVLSAGVRQDPNISAIATRKIHEIEILIWNYHDEDVDAPATPIDLVITGLPESSELAPKPGAPIPLSPISLVAMPLAPISLAMVEHFRVDSHHSNAFTAWKQIGSPQSPSPEQYGPPDNCSFSLRQPGFRSNAAKPICNSPCPGKACLSCVSPGDGNTITSHQSLPVTLHGLPPFASDATIWCFHAPC